MSVDKFDEIPPTIILAVVARSGGDVSDNPIIMLPPWRGFWAVGGDDANDDGAEGEDRFADSVVVGVVFVAVVVFDDIITAVVIAVETVLVTREESIAAVSVEWGDIAGCCGWPRLPSSSSTTTEGDGGEALDGDEAPSDDAVRLFEAVAVVRADEGCCCCTLTYSSSTGNASRRADATDFWARCADDEPRGGGYAS